MSLWKRGPLAAFKLDPNTGDRTGCVVSLPQLSCEMFRYKAIRVLSIFSRRSASGVVGRTDVRGLRDVSVLLSHVYELASLQLAMKSGQGPQFRPYGQQGAYFSCSPDVCLPRISSHLPFHQSQPFSANSVLKSAPRASTTILSPFCL